MNGERTGKAAPPAADAATRRGDLTEGPILRTLVMFAIPMLVGNLVQTINGSINAIWVGQLLGETALAATTVANGVMFLLFAGVFGLGNATTVRVGQHFGARNLEAARATFGTGLVATIAFAGVVGVVGWFAAPDLLHLLATPEASMADALAYLRIAFLTMPLGALGMTLAMGLRGVGEAKIPLQSTALTVLADVVLNPLLIRGFGPVPALGIAGSAIASTIASLFGLAWGIWAIYRRDLALAMRGTELRLLVPRRAELRYILTKGVPMSGQMLLVASAGLAMVGLVNREGVHTTAAFGAFMQLWNYLQMPAFAISMAVSAMVAQSIGAGKHGRVEGVTRAGMFSNIVMTGVLATAMTLAARPMVTLFLGAGSPAVEIAVHITRIVAWTAVVMGASMVMSGTLRAYGVVVLPMLIQATALFPVRLGFYFGAYPRLGGDALWWAYPVASALSAGMTWLLYTHGGWREKRTQVYATP